MGERQSACLLGCIGDAQPRYFYGVLQWHEFEKLNRDAAAGRFEARISRAVARDIGQRRIGDGRRSGGPKIVIGEISNINCAPGFIGDGIVRPGRDLVLLAVERPGETGPFRGCLKAEFLVGDHIDPWCGRGLAGADKHDIFAAIGGEPAIPVIVIERKRGEAGRRLRGTAGCAGRGRGFLGVVIGLHERRQLIGKASTPCAEIDSGCRAQRPDTFASYHIGSRETDSAQQSALLLSAIEGVHDLVQRLLQILRIGRCPLVQHHQIDRQTAHAPIIVRADELAHEAQMFFLADTDHDNRKIAGDAKWPKRDGSGCNSRQHFTRRAQRRVGIDHMVREELEQMGLIAHQTQVLQLRLGMGRRQGRRAIERGRFLMAVDEIDDFLAGFRRHGPERDRHRATARNLNAPAQGEDRVQYGARAVGERPSSKHGSGGAGGSVA